MNIINEEKRNKIFIKELLEEIKQYYLEMVYVNLNENDFEEKANKNVDICETIKDIKFILNKNGYDNNELNLLSDTAWILVNTDDINVFNENKAEMINLVNSMLEKLHDFKLNIQ